MADNVQLNPGVGGSVMRTLQHADGSHTSLGALAYATTISDGANVVQVVDAAHGMPVAVVGPLEVEQADENDLNATVFQGGSWVMGLTPGAEVKLASGSTVGLAGGSTVGVSGSVLVTQSIASNLNALVSQPTAANLNATVNQAGAWGVGMDGSVVYNGATAMPPKFAKIAASASGNNGIVAAVVGKRIRVLRWGLTAHGDVNAKWRSDSTDLTGERPLTKYASAGGAYCPIGLFQTAVGEALNLNLDAAVAVGGDITYVEVPAS